MKLVARMVAVAVFLIASTSFAASIDGTYSYASRIKDGKPDLVGWNGTMTIAGTTLSRKLKSADGKEERFYDTTLTNNGGDLYTLKTTKAYKPEYVGQEKQNKITLTGNVCTIASPDGSFKEVWNKK